MSCCTHDCRQGRDCPARMAPAAIEKAAAPVNPGHNAASDLPPKFIDDSIDEFLDDTGLLLLQGIALLSFVVSALMCASVWF